MTSRGVMTRGSSGDCWCDRKFVSTDGHRGGAPRSGSHRNIGTSGAGTGPDHGAGQSVVTRYHRCYFCKCQQSDDAETNL